MNRRFGKNDCIFIGFLALFCILVCFEKLTEIQQASTDKPVVLLRIQTLNLTTLVGVKTASYDIFTFTPEQTRDYM